METSFPVPRLLASAFVLAWLLPTPPSQGAQTEAQIAECVARNSPRSDSVRALRVSSKNRAGEIREIMVKLFTQTRENGFRRVAVKFTEPADLAGASFLMVEREGPNEMYFRSAADAKAKRISGDARALQLLGADITYEDLEHLLAFRRPEQSTRLPDETLRKRPVYVIETRTPGTSYDRVVTSIDQERCVALRAEFYEKGKGLRKELTVNPDRVLKRGGVWVPQVALMTDLRDGTSTMLLVDSTQQDVAMDDSIFAIEPR